MSQVSHQLARCNHKHWISREVLLEYRLVGRYFGCDMDAIYNTPLALVSFDDYNFSKRQIWLRWSEWSSFGMKSTWLQVKCLFWLSGGASVDDMTLNCTSYSVRCCTTNCQLDICKMICSTIDDIDSNLYIFSKLTETSILYRYKWIISSLLIFIY